MNYDYEQEFYDQCDRFCICAEDGNVLCNEIKCPSRFGLDVINPFCLEWESHKEFVPTPPSCCPPVPKCMFDGACEYKGQKFINFDNIPANMTGCEQRCHCENGEVQCQEACTEPSKEPPGYLSCSKDVAIMVPNEDRPCCVNWGCPRVPKDFKIQGVAIQPENETSLVISVGVPRILDGKEGYFEVFFTNGVQGHPDWTQWPKKIIRPPGNTFHVDADDKTTVILSELLPNQQYFLRVSLNVQEYNSEDVVVISNIVSGSTPPTR